MRTPSCSHRSRMERGERGKMVCEVCGRKRRKGARITEAKVRNWSKKRETASRRKGGIGQVMGRRDGRTRPPREEGKFRRTAVGLSLPGGPRTPPAPSEPRPMPTSVSRGRLLQLLSHLQTPAVHLTRPSASCAGEKHALAYRPAATLGTGKGRAAPAAEPAATSGRLLAHRSPRRGGAGPGAGHCGKGVDGAACENPPRAWRARPQRGGEGGVGLG